MPVVLRRGPHHAYLNPLMTSNIYDDVKIIKAKLEEVPTVQTVTRPYYFIISTIRDTSKSSCIESSCAKTVKILGWWPPTQTQRGLRGVKRATMWLLARLFMVLWQSTAYETSSLSTFLSWDFVGALRNIHTYMQWLYQLLTFPKGRVNCFRMWDFWLQLLVRFWHSQCCNTYMHTSIHTYIHPYIHPYINAYTHAPKRGTGTYWSPVADLFACSDDDDEEDLSGQGSISQATTGTSGQGVIPDSSNSQVALGDGNVHVYIKSTTIPWMWPTSVSPLLPVAWWGHSRMS